MSSPESNCRRSRSFVVRTASITRIWPRCWRGRTRSSLDLAAARQGGAPALRRSHDVAGAIYPRRVTPPVGACAFDADLNFLVRWVGPLGLLARAMLAYVFIVEGARKIAGYSGVAGYMQAQGLTAGCCRWF